MVAADTSTRLISSFNFSIHGRSLDNLDVAEFTPPEFAGTAVCLQSSANGITTTVSMQGGYTEIPKITAKVAICSDSNSAFMRLWSWLESCTPKARGGGGEFQKLQGTFTSINWKGDEVEKYEFTDMWPSKCEIDEVKADEQKDLMYATFSFYAEKFERFDVG